MVGVDLLFLHSSLRQVHQFNPSTRRSFSCVAIKTELNDDVLVFWTDFWFARSTVVS